MSGFLSLNKISFVLANIENHNKMLKALPNILYLSDVYVAILVNTVGFHVVISVREKQINYGFIFIHLLISCGSSNIC